MEQVLAVNDIDFDPSKVTDISELSAEEYLIYVRYEAEQCPAVVRAPIDSTKYEGCQTEYMPKMSDIPICPDIFLPSPEWVNDVVDKFSQFRLQLSEMSKDLSTRQRKQAVPSMKDEASWFKFCLGGSLAKADGSEEEALHIKARIVKSLEDDMNLRKNILLASLVTANEEEENDSDGHQIALHTTPDDIDDADDKEGEDDILQEPIVIEYASGELPCNKLLLQFDQVLTQRLLGFLSNWLKFPFLQKWYIGLPPGNDESEYPSGEKIYSWIFALLSRLEKPLYMDASATVRDIYRSLSIQRNEMADYVLSQVHENSKNIENAGPAKRSRDCSKDLDLKISTLPDNIRKALALQNTVIAICGRYFGQEEIGKIADNNDYNDVSTRIQTTQSYPHSQIFSHEAYKLDGDGDY